MTTRTRVLVNSKAGVERRDDIQARVARAFADHGLDTEIVVFRDGTELAREARRAVDEGCGALVAGGGDGTIGCVASVVAGTQTTLGVLPLGTLNHFAKDLGIPLKLDDAVGVIAAGHVHRVDVGEVNGCVFVNNSSIGLYPTIVVEREQQQRLGKRKWSAFARALFTVIGRYPLIRVSVRADGVPKVRKTPLVFVGNNSYEIHGLKLGTRRRLDAGRLSVYLTRDVGRWTLFGFALRALVGRLREHKDFEEVETSEVSIRTMHRRMRVAADGEVTDLDTPLEYRIRPRALRVFAPTPEKLDGPREAGNA
ncbi:MAG: diacylglycerol kinase family lipid kinase [Planctomycetaceae bacterium]|nr:diacylglycerol kinase family lipid kinase [Planctomycetaceae bacterium]